MDGITNTYTTKIPLIVITIIPFVAFVIIAPFLVSLSAKHQAPHAVHRVLDRLVYARRYESEPADLLLEERDSARGNP